MVSQFRFRQFLFACQARILGKLDRHIEVHCVPTIASIAIWEGLNLQLCQSAGHEQLCRVTVCCLWSGGRIAKNSYAAAHANGRSILHALCTKHVFSGLQRRPLSRGTETVSRAQIGGERLQVAERGLKFVNTLGELLASAGLPSTLKETWAFSACLALAVQLARTAPVSSAGMQPALMPTISDAR